MEKMNLEFVEKYGERIYEASEEEIAEMKKNNQALSDLMYQFVNNTTDVAIDEFNKFVDDLSTSEMVGFSYGQRGWLKIVRNDGDWIQNVWFNGDSNPEGKAIDVAEELFDTIRDSEDLDLHADYFVLKLSSHEEPIIESYSSREICMAVYETLEDTVYSFYKWLIYRKVWPFAELYDDSFMPKILNHEIMDSDKEESDYLKSVDSEIAAKISEVFKNKNDLIATWNDFVTKFYHETKGTEEDINNVLIRENVGTKLLEAHHGYLEDTLIDVSYSSSSGEYSKDEPLFLYMEGSLKSFYRMKTFETLTACVDEPLMLCFYKYLICNVEGFEDLNR